MGYQLFHPFRLKLTIAFLFLSLLSTFNFHSHSHYPWWSIYHGNPSTNISKTILYSFDYHSKNIPGIRYFSSFVQGDKDMKENIYIFGGAGHTINGERRYLCDMWTFNTKKKMWKWLGQEGKYNKGWAGMRCIENGDDERMETRKSYYWNGYNQPGGRVGSVMYNNPMNSQRLFLFGGFVFNSEVWEFDINSKYWRLIRDTSWEGKYSHDWNGTISSRVVPAYWLINEESSKLLYIFGGAGVNGEMNDMWKYDIITNKYMFLRGNNSTSTETDNVGNYGKRNVYDKENIVPSRYGAAFWKNNNNTLLFIFGGIMPYRNIVFNDVWVYNININQFVWILGNNNFKLEENNYTMNNFHKNNIPANREAMFFWQIGNKVLIYGGDTFEIDLGTGDLLSFGIFGDLWEFEMENNTFRCVQFCGTVNKTLGRTYNSSNPNIIDARTTGVSVKDHNGNPLLFGGEYGKNEIWIYNLEDSVKCRNVSIYEDYICSNHGICENETCICQSNNYEGDECSIWSCNNITTNNMDVCNGKGICRDINECKCFIYQGELCDEYTCFLYEKYSKYRCNGGIGNCTALNECKCPDTYMGDQCQEHIVIARFGDMFHNFVNIEYEVPHAYTFGNRGDVDEGENYRFNCSRNIINFDEFGSDSYCTWVYNEPAEEYYVFDSAENAIELHINLGENYIAHKVVINVITTNEIVELEIEKAILTLREWLDILFFVVCIALVVLTICLFMLTVCLAFKYCLEIRRMRAQAFLNAFDKPHTP